MYTKAQRVKKANMLRIKDSMCRLPKPRRYLRKWYNLFGGLSPWDMEMIEFLFCGAVSLEERYLYDNVLPEVQK